MVFAPRRFPPPHLTFPRGATFRGRNRLPMGKIRGFLEIERREHQKRAIGERLSDWREFELAVPDAELAEQAARCMDCGIPFCHDGCPLGNLIPDWNDMLSKGRLEDAAAALHATNNFPEV